MPIFLPPIKVHERKDLQGVCCMIIIVHNNCNALKEGPPISAIIAIANNPQLTQSIDFNHEFCLNYMVPLTSLAIICINISFITRTALKTNQHSTRWFTQTLERWAILQHIVCWMFSPITCCLASRTQRARASHMPNPRPRKSGWPIVEKSHGWHAFTLHTTKTRLYSHRFAPRLPWVHSENKYGKCDSTVCWMFKFFLLWMIWHTWSK